MDLVLCDVGVVDVDVDVEVDVMDLPVLGPVPGRLLFSRSALALATASFALSTFSPFPSASCALCSSSCSPIMSALVKGSSLTRSCQCFALTLSRSTVSLANTFPVCRSATTRVPCVKGRYVTGSTISLSSLRVKFRRTRSAARSGGPLGSTGLEDEAEDKDSDPEPLPFLLALLLALCLASQLSIAAWS